MDTLISWTYVALWFLGPIAVTSAIGWGCYLFVHWLEKVVPDPLAYVEIVSLFAAACFCLVMFPFSLVLLVVLLPVCVGGAFAERAIGGASEVWGAGFVRLLFTTVCCIALSVGALIVFVVTAPPRVLSLNTPITFYISSFWGPICSPSMVSVFIWVWRNSQARPGVERHLDVEDGVEGNESK